MSIKFSIVHPYFENNATLPLHVEQWSKIPKNQVELVIVDDHSGPNKGPDVSLLKDLQFPIKVFRVKNDILWNVTGARNLGAYYARGEQLIMSDFDLVVGAELISKLKTLDYTDNKVVYWPVMRKPDTEKTKNRFAKPHCNSFVINRDVFWRMGGYDEDFAGGWGYEDSHFHNILGKLFGLKNVILDNSGYFIWLDSAAHHPGTITIGRKGHKKNETLYYYKAKQTKDFRSDPTLRFEYELIYDNGK